MESYTYDGSRESLGRLVELQRTGVKIVCPKCGTELIVALDYETANKYKVHTGIYCPVDRSHVFEMIELRRPSISEIVGQNQESADKPSAFGTES